MKLHIYDQVVMGNTCFKFQLDRMHGLAARIIKCFDMGSFCFLDFKNFLGNKAHLAVPGWV